MGRIIRWMEATGHMDLLVRIHWWGGITIAYTGDKTPDPSTYRPLPRTFRPLTDEGWGSSLPLNLEGLSSFAARHALIFPCVVGEVAAKRPEGALRSTLDTS